MLLFFVTQFQVSWRSESPDPDNRSEETPLSLTSGNPVIAILTMRPEFSLEDKSLVAM